MTSSSCEDESNFKDLYKNYGKTFEHNHEEKRLEFLNKQKEKRASTFDELRNLSDLFDENDQMEIEEDSKTKGKRNKIFRNRLMNAELLKKLPDDFEENWLIKMCPQGQRCLMVAEKGTTICYRDNGYPCGYFKSNLPGSQKYKGDRFTVLDCVYNKDSNTYFIMDVLAWNNLSLLNGESSLRFFWLQSKFSEDSNLLTVQSKKQYQLHVVDYIKPDLSLIQDILFNPLVINHHNLAYEGILLYHKDAHYRRNTPLVGWIPTFLVNRVLNIDCDPIHLKPRTEEEIEKYVEKKNKKKTRCKVDKDVEMTEQC